MHASQFICLLHCEWVEVWCRPKVLFTIVINRVRWKAAALLRKVSGETVGRSVLPGALDPFTQSTSWGFPPKAGHCQKSSPITPWHC